MIIQVFQGSERVLARSPGKERIPFLQIFQPLVVCRGSKVSAPGQGQADSLHIFGKGAPVGVDQYRRKLPPPIRITGQPVDAQLAPVKEFGFPVYLGYGFEGMEKKIIRLTAHQENEKMRKKEKEFPAAGHNSSFFSLISFYHNLS
jgi:hypothetical protein